MRKWGKWVAEIREPNKRSRIWLGSYSSPVAAAKAYDTALFLLRGPSALLNFPEEIPAEESDCTALTASSIRKKAAEVGARVDALQKRHALVPVTPPRPDLNEQPSPETAPEEIVSMGI
nr:ethylen response factor 10 [Erycina pusilla]